MPIIEKKELAQFYVSISSNEGLKGFIPDYIIDEKGPKQAEEVKEIISKALEVT